MTAQHKPESALETILSGSLNADTYDLDELADWCLKACQKHHVVELSKSSSMKETEKPTDILRYELRANLLGETYDLDGLADWCQRAYPQIASCCEFRKQLLDAIHHPGLVSPKTYESWTDDDSYPTQDLLQEHFKEIWNACFPTEAVD